VFTIAPATEALELYDTDFTNGFRDQSPYGGPPTPEVEARWDKLWNVGGISISEDNLLSLNRTTEGYVRFSEEKGGGYAAVIEVYHHLHCLVSRNNLTPACCGPHLTATGRRHDAYGFHANPLPALEPPPHVHLAGPL
jgi:hypothetical protein